MIVYSLYMPAVDRQKDPLSESPCAITYQIYTKYIKTNSRTLRTAIECICYTVVIRSASGFLTTVDSSTNEIAN